MNEVERSEFNLIVDSGAFTAWNTGRSISLDEYCTFLDSIEKLRPFHAVQLDVFGDPEASWKNYLIMKERGYDVMPVFTRGENLEMLEEMYKLTDYIMFGGVVIGRGNKNYVKWFLERNKGRDAHWLGFVNMPFIKAYRPRSVDSSSWRGAARYGNVSFYFGSGDIKTFNKKVFRKRPTDEIYKIAKFSGIKPEELKMLSYSRAWIDSGYFDGNLDVNREDKNTAAQFISTLAHVHRSIDVEKNIGTKIYLAVGEFSHLKLLFNAKRFLEERGIV